MNCFADNFRLQLDTSEFDNLKSQSVISSWGGSRKLPFYFYNFDMKTQEKFVKFVNSGFNN